jgi:hypothetical protein
VNGAQIFTGDFPEVLGMSFGDNKGVPLGNRVDVFKRQDLVVLIDLETGDLPFYYFAKYAVLHLYPPFTPVCMLTFLFP